MSVINHIVNVPFYPRSGSVTNKVMTQHESSYHLIISHKLTLQPARQNKEKPNLQRGLDIMGIDALISQPLLYTFQAISPRPPVILLKSTTIPFNVIFYSTNRAKHPSYFLQSSEFNLPLRNLIIQITILHCFYRLGVYFIRFYSVI